MRKMMIVIFTMLSMGCREESKNYRDNFQEFNIQQNKFVDMCKSNINADVAYTIKILKETAKNENCEEVFQILDDDPWLMIWGADLKNIEPIGFLKNLDTLFLGLNQIEDIDPLKNLTKLEFLSVGGSPVKDISALENLTNLVWLDLGGTLIDNLLPLKRMDKLKTLHISDINITDITSIGSLVELEKLIAERNQISNVSELRHLKKLNNLQLYSNQIENISDLKDLSNLEFILMGKNPLGETILKTEENCSTNSKSKIVSDWCKSK